MQDGNIYTIISYAKGNVSAFTSEWGNIKIYNDNDRKKHLYVKNVAKESNFFFT